MTKSINNHNLYYINNGENKTILEAYINNFFVIEETKIKYHD